ncbi:MAG: hypothetical protein RL264_2609 [Bacteroidota bacterium]|jgi:uncharacterized protein with HEPN domain
MEIKTKKLLFDILSSIEQIEVYLNEVRSFDEYDESSILQDAVERKLITFGGATNQLLKNNSDLKITDARRIVDTRNKLTHGYDDIDSQLIWNLNQIHLPILKNEIVELLKN